jgi:hypothetical protein
VWLSRKRYNSLCRAAGERLKNSGEDGYSNQYNATGMLLWRLSGKHHMAKSELLPVPFEFIQAIDVDDKFVVFVVHNGEALMFEDDHSLYPSDGLVAKLRLLRGNNLRG